MNLRIKDLQLVKPLQLEELTDLEAFQIVGGSSDNTAAISSAMDAAAAAQIETALFMTSKTTEKSIGSKSFIR